MSDETLEKKWKEALVGLGMAAATPTFAQDKPPAAPTTQTAPKVEEFKFDPKTLHHDLAPIAQLESSGGKNMAHKPSPKGEQDTAYGALGLKGSTAHEEYLKSPALQKLHPHLADFTALLGEMKYNPTFYNNVAASHWNRLKKLTGSNEKAAYAWRYGPGNAAKTPEQAIMADKYVQGYQKLSQPAVQKSEDLDKAIKDLKPGKPTWRDKGKSLTLNPPHINAQKSFNMDHLLTPKHIAQGYSMTAHDNGHQMEVTAHHQGKLIGHVSGLRATSSPVLKDRMHVDHALIDPQHRGQGLGTAMYEGLYAHAKHKAGINVVMGGTHSSMASGVHQKLAAKHGLGYKPTKEWGTPLSSYSSKQAWDAAPNGEYDNKYGDYRFRLSEEDLGKAIKDKYRKYSYALKYDEFAKNFEKWSKKG